MGTTNDKPKPPSSFFCGCCQQEEFEFRNEEGLPPLHSSRKNTSESHINKKPHIPRLPLDELNKKRARIA